MPKTASGKALKKARKQLQITFKPVEGSETEDSPDSDSSADLSHIALKDINLPELANLSLTETTEMDQAINSIVQQLQQINASVTNLTQRQEAHEQIINGLAQPRNDGDQNEQAQNNAQNVSIMDFFRIPDPIKALPHYDGSKRQLHAWLTTAEDTLNYFKGKVDPSIFKMYVTAVTNKIERKAKDILCLSGNPQEFDSIKDILTNALGDKQELSTYKCQLWQHRMTDGMSIHKYYHRSKELIQNIKTLAKQNEKYKQNWTAINMFIEENGLAAFTSGLKGTYFGHVQAARPKDVEDAYAFLCKFKSQELVAHTTSEKPNKAFTKQERIPKNDNTSYRKPEFRPNLPQEDRSKPHNNQATPMDVDPSLRSRLTLNKKLINNTELE